MTDLNPAVQLLGPVEIRTLAEQLGISPTKKLGQNFVHDPNTVRRIVAAGGVTAADHVVEVGPGLGSLTLALLGVVHQVTVIEIDPPLAEQLPATIAERAPEAADNLRVILSDALAVSGADLVLDADDGPSATAAPTALVANLPYNVSVPVLLHLLAELPSLRRVLVMVQLEVAERLAAEPGSRTYGVPSVKAGFYGTVSRAGTVGPNVFWPVPKVDSGLVKMELFDDTNAPWPVTEELRKKVWPLVDAAFAQRRKTLRAALGTVYGSPAAAEEALVAAGIDPKLRGEKLTTADFVHLAQAAPAQAG